MLEREARKMGHSAAKIMKHENLPSLFKIFKVPDLDEILTQIGFGKLEPNQVVLHLYPDAKEIEKAGEEPKTFLGKVFKSAVGRTRKSGSLIQVDGLTDILVRFGKCCNPIPGDSIIGTISRGRGITVHHASCPKAFDADKGRYVDVAWTKQSGDSTRPVRIRVTSQNITGLLNAMTEVFKSQGIDVLNAQIRTTKDNRAICDFDVSVKNTSQLSNVQQGLMKIKGVMDVERVTQI
jgi:GTP diphosphokinase / guanosine-3',5'-bis(diphosphate) 3'-diphosphatase